MNMSDEQMKKDYEDVQELASQAILRVHAEIAGHMITHGMNPDVLEVRVLLMGHEYCGTGGSASQQARDRAFHGPSEGHVQRAHVLKMDARTGKLDEMRQLSESELPEALEEVVETAMEMGLDDKDEIPKV